MLPPPLSTQPYDLVIIGGGITGLSILRHATLSNLKCTLLESTPHLLSSASGSNSGIACTGVDAPLHSLERALVRDSISHIRGFCDRYNVPKRECGSLVCLRGDDTGIREENNASEKNTRRLEEVAKESRDAGDAVSILSREEVSRLEPALSSDDVFGAVHVHGEIVLDPWLYSVTFALHARENGADVVTDFCVGKDGLSFDDETRLWTVREEGRGVGRRCVMGRTVVNAAGLFAENLHGFVKGVEALKWETRPRRGQYCLFRGGESLRRPVQPVPTSRTKGIFVFSSLYDQVVVGPTALDQVSKTDRSVDSRVAESLKEYGAMVVPALRGEEIVGDYVGIRPGTTMRDYQIRAYYSVNYVIAAGIRSTGLTASLGVGRYVVGLLRNMIEFPEYTGKEMVCSPIPDVSELVEQFHQSDEGDVEIGGFTYRVTHPITRFGWRERTGLAKPTHSQRSRL